jgi:hypothetical protein
MEDLKMQKFKEILIDVNSNNTKLYIEKTNYGFFFVIRDKDDKLKECFLVGGHTVNKWINKEV